MIEQMEKQMTDESAADERQLRERILATQQLVRELQQQYQDIYGCPPVVPTLGASAQGVEFCAGVEDAQDSIDGQCVLERERQIEQYEAAGGFADSDPDGMS